MQPFIQLPNWFYKKSNFYKQQSASDKDDAWDSIEMLMWLSLFVSWVNTFP